MLVDILYLLAGLAVLYFGAEYLVRGSSNFAIGLGVRPMIVGLTVVAFGTSMPEFFVSFTSALKNSSEIAVGNIVGSNICNIGLIVGLAALVRPLRVDSGTLKREMPIMLLVSALFWILALDGVIGRVDGAILFIGIIAFTLFLLKVAMNEKSVAEDETSAVNKKENAKNIIMALCGILALVIGANLMIKGAVSLAEKIGVSELVIGLSIVAFGTSLPELATSLVAAARGNSDISLGNVIGSNIFNILFIIGLTAMVRPIPVAHDIIVFQTPIMLAFSIVLLPFMILNRDINRIEGGVLLAGYAAFVGWIFV